MNEVIKVLSRRYATKAYDTSKKLTENQLETLIQAARLSPSSNGLQPYEVFVALNPELREKLREVSFGQKPITDAAALFILARYSAFPKDYIERYIQLTARVRGMDIRTLDRKKNSLEDQIASMTPAQIDAWNKNQTYILLGTLVSAAAWMGIDATPMEGFEPEKYDEILGLEEKGLKSTVIMAAGYHSEDDWLLPLKKVRRPVEELVTILR